MNKNLLSYLTTSRTIEGAPKYDDVWDQYIEWVKIAATRKFPNIDIPEIHLITSRESLTEHITLNNKSHILIDFKLQAYFDEINEFTAIFPAYADNFLSFTFDFLSSKYVERKDYRSAFIMTLFKSECGKKIDEELELQFKDFEKEYVDNNPRGDTFLDLMRKYNDFISWHKSQKASLSHYPNYQDFGAFQKIFIIAHELAHHIFNALDYPELKRERKDLGKWLYTILHSESYIDEFIDLWEIDINWVDSGVLEVSHTVSEEIIVDKIAFTLLYYCFEHFDYEVYIDKQGLSEESINIFEDRFRTSILLTSVLQSLLNIKTLRLFELIIDCYNRNDGEVDNSDLDFGLIDILKEFYIRYSFLNQWIISDHFDNESPKIHIEDNSGKSHDLNLSNYCAQKNIETIDSFIKLILPHFLSKAGKIYQQVSAIDDNTIYRLFLSEHTIEVSDGCPPLGNPMLLNALEVEQINLTVLEKEILNNIKDRVTKMLK